MQLAPTKPLATALTPLLQIPWVAARRTRVGARHASDGGGMANVVYCSSNDLCKIIIMLYPHLPAVIPPTFHLPTLALPTPAPVDFTLRPALPLQISTQRLPPCEDIPTRNLYAVTQHLLTRRNYIFLNSLSGFYISNS